MRLLLISSLFIPLSIGCGDTSKAIPCGDGTHEEGGECVPDEVSETDAAADADADAALKALNHIRTPQNKQARPLKILRARSRARKPRQ